MDRTLIVNLADAPAATHPARAALIDWEPEDAPFPDTGVNVQIMQPGQPNCRYHSEPVQEDFLHCPAGVEHVFVGAGDGPCAVLMIGSRRRDEAHYPVNEVAARYGASAARATDDPEEAYADWRRDEWTRVPSPWPLG
jgi:uncharacterized cupin superfamily protein